MSISEKIKNQQSKTDLRKQKLLNGEYGLAKTFWLFWLLPTIVLTLIETYDKSVLRSMAIDITIIILSAVIIKCILKTNGRALWKGISIIWIVLYSLLAFLALFTYF